MFKLIIFLFFLVLFFFFNDTATTEIYTLSLHDALPISALLAFRELGIWWSDTLAWPRSEEHTSELQSRFDLVCRLLLEKKKTRLRVIFLPCKTKLLAIGVIFLLGR